MDEIDKQEVTTAEPTETEQLETTQEEETVVDEIDWESKAKELEAENSKLSRQLKRAKRDDTEKAEKSGKHITNESTDFDWGMKAYLRAEGIEAAEFDFVQDQISESGMPLEKLLSNSYFKSQLKEFRDTRAAQAATPTGSRAKSDNPKSKADYWMQRGELPPDTPENIELRREVVNKRYETEKARARFTGQSVVES